MPVTLDQLRNVENLQRVHPDWLDYREFWSQVDEIRTRKIDLDKHLVRGWLEPQEEFGTRKRMTHFVPETPVALGQVCGAICSDQPDRSQLPGGLGDWSRKVDLQGRTLGTWMEKLAVPDALYYGALHVVVDPPPAPEGVIPETMQDLIDLGIREPRLAAYSPLAVRNWRVDSRTGEIEWVLIFEEGYAVTDGLEPRRPQRTYRVWTRTEIHEIKTVPEDDRFGSMSWDAAGNPSDNVMGSGRGERIISATSTPNQVGVVPMITFMTEPVNDIIGASFVRSAVVLDFKRLLLESDHMLSLHMDGHQQLVIRSRKSPEEVGVGVGKYIHLDPGGPDDPGETAEYLAHSPEGFQAREREIRRTHVDSRRQLGADPRAIHADEGGSGQPESGVSRTISYRTSEGRHVANLRESFEHYENQLLRLVALFLGSARSLPDGVLLEWPRLQQDEPTADTVDALSDAKSAVRSETYKRECEKRIVNATLGDDLPEDKRAAIENEIDTTEAPNPLAALAVGGFGSDGAESDGGPPGEDVDS